MSKRTFGALLKNFHEHLYINPGKGLPLVCKICGHRWSL